MSGFFLSTQRFYVAVAAVALLAAGCGGGGEGSLSKAQFLRRATAICKGTTKQLQEGFVKLTEEKNRPSLGKGVKVETAELVRVVFAPTYRRQIEELGALGSPAGEEKTVAAILAAMRRGLEKSKTESLQLVRSSAPLAEAAKLAKAYGLTSCTG